MATIKAYASNIISPYHRTGILAFLEFFSSASRPVEASIHTDAGNWKNKLLDEETLQGSHYRATVTGNVTRFGVVDLLRAALSLLRRRDAGDPECLIMGHSRVNIKLLASLFASGQVDGSTRIATVVIDEGIGSYAGYRYRYRAFCRENHPGCSARLLYGLIYPFNQHLLKWHRLIDYDWRLLGTRKSDRYRPNTRAIDYYRQHFVQAGATPPARPGHPDVLLVTQPLTGLGLIRNDEYQETLARLKRLCDAAGLVVQVKPHPAEDPRQYHGLGMEPVADNTPVESFIGVRQPGMVLGFSSTALINSRLIFGIHSASMLGLLPGGEQVKASLFEDRAIRSLYLDNVDFLENWRQLEDRLGELRSRHRESQTVS